MPLIEYVPHRFRLASLEMIDFCNEIALSYAAQGYDLTLRQLFYQGVARGGRWPNTEKSYKALGDLVGNARLAGLIDWEHITDRTRGLRGIGCWSSPREAIEDAARGFHLDKWASQPFRPEVWIEKEALAGVLRAACNPLFVDYFSCRGYTSLSEMWRAAQRLYSYVEDGQTPVVFYLGDHDPSGLDMGRDIKKRLDLFLSPHGVSVRVERLALNLDQTIGLPPNPAKTTDSRYADYIAQYGYESWELDALEPQLLVGLIRDAVLALRDEAAWVTKVAQEDEQRGHLHTVARQWDHVAIFLSTLKP